MTALQPLGGAADAITPDGWTVEPLTGTIGAIIHGADLTEPLDARQVAAVRSALLGHRVVFFRDQHISPSQQVAFARNFGTLTPAHPLVGGLDDQHPEVLQLDSADYPLGVGSRGKGTSYNNRWHTDVTFSATPPAFQPSRLLEPPACPVTVWYFPSPIFPT